MTAAERIKGRRAEAEVAAIYRLFGYTVRGLEGQGDHLVSGHGVTIHSEVKRQEVLRLPLWCRQARREAPAGTIPVVSYRRNHDRWHALTPEPMVTAMLRAAEMAAGIDYTLRDLGGEWWVHTELSVLLPALRRPA